MPLPTQKTSADISLSSYTTLIYGAPKRGKSTFGSQFPSAVFLDTEQGLRALNVFRVPTNSWEAFCAACGEIAAGDHEFQTVIIDTVDVLYQYCVEYKLRELGIKHESEAEYGKAYAVISGEFQRVLRKLAGLPYGLVFISHAKEIEIKTRTGKIKKIVPTLPERGARIILGMVDLLLYVDIDSEDDANGAPIEKSVLRTKPTSYYDAGDRTGLLPETLPLSFDAFKVAFDAAAKVKNEAKGSQVPAVAADPAETQPPPQPDNAAGEAAA